MTDAETLMPVEWECFCDICYFHQWAVRPVGDKKFTSQRLFHVPSKEEAEALRDILNTRTISAPVVSREDAKAALERFDKGDKYPFDIRHLLTIRTLLEAAACEVQSD